MTLAEIIENLDDFEEADTIYAAAPWTPDSNAVVATEPEAGDLPLVARELGLKYFLEILIAREVLTGCAAALGHELPLAQQVEQVIYYALNDAYLD
jgi:hypothetical protein